MALDDSSAESAVRGLYFGLLDAWNRRSGAEFGAFFAPQGCIVGFDGSQVNGADSVAAHLSAIFAEHATPRYVGIVEEVRIIADGVAVLRSVSGLIPPGQDDIVPALNAIQSLVATRTGDAWRIELYQNTPAQFHGHPELADALSARLRAAVQATGAAP